MPHCMVPQCSNDWRKTKGTDITYHRLPSGSMKSTWLRSIKRDNPRKPEHSFVYSVHLEPKCFEPATEICGRKKPKTLTSSAVPTLFAFTKAKKGTTRPSSQRQIKARESEFISSSQFYTTQDKFLFPVINNAWNSSQAGVIQQLRQALHFDICGDGRCDGHGHSAKYGTYSMMDEKSGKVVEFSVIQVAEVTSSNAMDYEGCK